MSATIATVDGKVAASRKQFPSADRKLLQETEAARILREQLADLADGDEEVVRDTIEGATNLHELIAAVVEDIAADMASIEGIDAHLKRMRARKERLEARIESRRAVILNAMAVGEIKKLELPIATLSRQAVAPKVIITEEAAIPAEFWKRADPTLDKKALLVALKDWATVAEELAKKDGFPEETVAELHGKLKPIPGATLSNGGETLAVRFS